MTSSNPSSQEEIQELEKDQILSGIAKALESWPLYRPFYYRAEDYQEPTSYPAVIRLRCPICAQNENWSNSTPGARRSGGFHTPTYVCRNCQKATSRYFCYWGDLSDREDGTSLFMKVGQWPALEERIPPELESRLAGTGGTDLDFYKKALRSRNFGYGLGALAYLRRVVENRMNDVLDLIADVAEASEFAEEELKQLETVKSGRTFDEKVTYAAKILPKHLRPGGTNPVDLLHDLASDGIHNRLEEECIEIFDSSRVVFEHLFQQLQIRKEEANKYIEDIRTLTGRRTGRAAKIRSKEMEDA